MLGNVAILNVYLKKKFYILNQGKERAAKTKLLSAKLRAESHCAELDSTQCDTILDLR